MEAKVSPSPSRVSPIESWLGKVHQGDCIETDEPDVIGVS